MRRHILLLATVLPVLALAGCSDNAHETKTTVTKDGVTTTTVTTSDGDNSVVSGLKIDTDKFKANLDIPGISFGGDHFDMDGMKLYPGSTVNGVRVHATDKPGDDHGDVVMAFTSPAAPAVVAKHMADQALAAGFMLTSNTTALISGSKPDDDGTNRFSVTLAPQGTATTGQLTVTGAKTKE
jgi:hypothetical protein